MTPAEKEDIKNIIRETLIENLTIKVRKGFDNKEIEIWYDGSFVTSDYIDY